MIHPAHVKHDARHRTLSERFAEPIASFLGTGRYLMLQTVVIIMWVALNGAAIGLRWDPYPFILLNLVFSTQASYAAPLILLSQSRQAKLDRERADHDHEASDENIKLTREIYAAVLKEQA